MKAPVSLTSDELLAVLAKARERRLRDWVMLLVIYWHGYRVSEVVRSSTRQRGLFFTRAKAEQRLAELQSKDGEYGESSEVQIREVERVIKGKPQPCFLVESKLARKGSGLTLGALEGQEMTVQRLKHSMETVQGIQEHENPLLNERLAWEEWLAEGTRYGKKGGSKMQQKDVLLHFQEIASVFNISRSQLFRLYRGYARAAGLPRRKQHPHCLKHTIGTHLWEAGVPLPQIQVHLGHKNLSSTGKYTLPREDAVSKAVGKAIRGKDEFRPFRQGKLF